MLHILSHIDDFKHDEKPILKYFTKNQLILPFAFGFVCEPLALVEQVVMINTIDKLLNGFKNCW